MNREEAHESDLYRLEAEWADGRQEFQIGSKKTHELINKIFDDFELKIKKLEAILEETVKMPKGVEPHSLSDYKEENMMREIKFRAWDKSNKKTNKGIKMNKFLNMMGYIKHNGKLDHDEILTDIVVLSVVSIVIVLVAMYSIQ